MATSVLCWMFNTYFVLCVTWVTVCNTIHGLSFMMCKYNCVRQNKVNMMGCELYIFLEYTDMNLLLGQCNRNANEAVRQYGIKYPNQCVPNAHF